MRSQYVAESIEILEDSAPNPGNSAAKKAESAIVDTEKPN